MNDPLKELIDAVRYVVNVREIHCLHTGPVPDPICARCRIDKAIAAALTPSIAEGSQDRPQKYALCENEHPQLSYKSVYLVSEADAYMTQLEQRLAEAEAIKSVDARQMGARFDRYLEEGKPSGTCSVNWFEMQQNKSILLYWWKRFTESTYDRIRYGVGPHLLTARDGSQALCGGPGVCPACIRESEPVAETGRWVDVTTWSVERIEKDGGPTVTLPFAFEEDARRVYTNWVANINTYKDISISLIRADGHKTVVESAPPVAKPEEAK